MPPLNQPGLDHLLDMHEDRFNRPSGSPFVRLRTTVSGNEWPVRRQW